MALWHLAISHEQVAVASVPIRLSLKEEKEKSWTNLASGLPQVPECLSFIFLNHSMELKECSEMGTLNNLVPAFIGTERNKTSRFMKVIHWQEGRRDDAKAHLIFFPVPFLPARERYCRTPFPACTRQLCSSGCVSLQARATLCWEAAQAQDRGRMAREGSRIASNTPLWYVD